MDLLLWGVVGSMTWWYALGKIYAMLLAQPFEMIALTKGELCFIETL